MDAAAPFGGYPRAAARAEDRRLVLLHPLAGPLERLDLLRRECARPFRPPAQQDVAVARQCADEKFDDFPGRLRGCLAIGPGAGNRHAAFPGAVVLEHADAVFGSVEIAREAGAVIDKNARLELTDHASEPLGIPHFGAKHPAPP